MLGVPSNLFFTVPFYKIRLRQSKRTPAVFFCVPLYFCNAHFYIRRPGRCLCHCKISVLIFAMLRICASSVQFFTLDLHFSCQKSMFRSSKVAMFWLFSAASRSSVFFTGTAKRRSAKQRHLFSGHGISTNSAHEGTAALQHRYTDARAAPT